MIIDRLWKGQPGNFFCISTKSKGTWKDHFFSRKELEDVGEFIDENKDKDLWFCPHGFSKARRLKPYAMMGNLLWADLDEANPREISIKPTIAIESSPGRFVGLWVMKGEIDETLNRRLTYAVGADRSGWDLTQVLRIPGSTNYKYQSMPRVKTLWIDGPEYSVKQLEKDLPEDEEEGVEDHEASEVFKQYEKVLPPWCRRELLNGKPTPGKRSEMIWKLGQTLIEAGVTREEAFVLLKASPWNKFQGRRNEDTQLRREIDKALNRHLTAGGKKAEAPTDGYKFLAEPISEVEAENLDWIWYPYLARGELSILEGDPGLGKSYLAEIISAYIVDGKRLPSVKKFKGVEGKVAYFDIENSAGSVTKKRLMENGCENMHQFFQEEEPFSIDDTERLEAVFDAIEKLRPTLVVFDTLNTYIGKADIHKSSESQQALANFRQIAKRFNCACLVLRHLTKGSKDKAIYRGQGSIAFAGLARVVMTVGTMPEDPDTRVMAITKINVTRPPKALCFTIKELPDTIKYQDRSRFEFGDFVDLTSDDIINNSATEKNSDRADASEFLKDALDEKGMDLSRLEKMAEARSISIRTLHRAADELGVTKKATGFGKKKVSMWTLPDNDA